MQTQTHETQLPGLSKFKQAMAPLLFRVNTANCRPWTRRLPAVLHNCKYSAWTASKIFPLLRVATSFKQLWYAIDFQDPQGWLESVPLHNSSSISRRSVLLPRSFEFHICHNILLSQSMPKPCESPKTACRCPKLPIKRSHWRSGKETQSS